MVSYNQTKCEVTRIIHSSNILDKLGFILPGIQICVPGIRVQVSLNVQGLRENSLSSVLFLNSLICENIVFFRFFKKIYLFGSTRFQLQLEGSSIFFAACGIFQLQHANSQLWHVGSSSLTRDQTQAPYTGRGESQPPDHQGSPRMLSLPGRYNGDFTNTRKRKKKINDNSKKTELKQQTF